MGAQALHSRPFQVAPARRPGCLRSRPARPGRPCRQVAAPFRGTAATGCGCPVVSTLAPDSESRGPGPGPKLLQQCNQACGQTSSFVERLNGGRHPAGWKSLNVPPSLKLRDSGQGPGPAAGRHPGPAHGPSRHCSAAGAAGDPGAGRRRVQSAVVRPPARTDRAGPPHKSGTPAPAYRAAGQNHDAAGSPIRAAELGSVGRRATQPLLRPFGPAGRARH